MASIHNILLLWTDGDRLCLPHVLLVSCTDCGLRKSDSMCSMRYSRMLEESSFANKKAEYLWLLILSAGLLLVRYDCL